MNRLARIVFDALPLNAYTLRVLHLLCKQLTAVRSKIGDAIRIDELIQVMRQNFEMNYWSCNRHFFILC